MDTGDIVKYTPTSTVGKVLDIKEENGVVWVKLDKTNLYYRQSQLAPAAESEYKTTSFRERETKLTATRESVDDITKEAREVDVSDMMPTGGG